MNSMLRPDTVLIIPAPSFTCEVIDPLYHGWPSTARGQKSACQDFLICPLNFLENCISKTVLRKTVGAQIPNLFGSDGRGVFGSKPRPFEIRTNKMVASQGVVNMCIIFVCMLTLRTE